MGAWIVLRRDAARKLQQRYQPTNPPVSAKSISKWRSGSKHDFRLHQVPHQQQLIEQCDREISNVVKFVREGTSCASLRDELARLEADKRELQQKRNAFSKRPRRPLVIPSMDELRARAANAFNNLAIESPEFSRVMGRLISAIHVFPFRCIDGGSIVLRARVALNLVPLAPELDGLSQPCDILRPQFVVDLFDRPQRVFYRETVNLWGFFYAHKRKGPQMSAQFDKNADLCNRQIGDTRETLQELLRLLAREVASELIAEHESNCDNEGSPLKSDESSETRR